MEAQSPVEYQMPSRRIGARSADHGPIPDRECAIFGRRVEVQLRHGNFHAARLVIDEAEKFKTVESIEWDTLLASTEIGDQQLRLLNVLEKNGIRTVGDLIKCDVNDLAGRYDVSVKSIGIVAQLAAQWRAEIEGRESQNS